MRLIKDLFVKKNSITVNIEAINGLHLRPCAKIASLAKEFPFDINFIFNNQSANAKNMNEILSLGLEYGNEITIITKGKNAKDALNEIKTLLDELSTHDSKISSSDEELLNNENQIISYDGEIKAGVSICGGVCVANIHFMNSELCGNEKMEFSNALLKSLDELEILSNDNENREKDIFLAQKAMLDNLPNSSYEIFNKAIIDSIKMLENTANQSKIADYKDIEKRVSDKMNGILIKDLPSYDFILISNELLPSEIKNISTSGIKGVIVQNISPRSHIALLLRSYNIPSITVDDISKLINIDNEIILDASSGLVAINPSRNDIDIANSRISNANMKSKSDASDRFETATTKSGKIIKILANITDYDSAVEAKESGCEGIGLLRTEFLFQTTKPTLDKQLYEYSRIFELFDEVTVRTLDVGGDKKLPYLIIPDEENPFLGVRGIRLFETHLDLMKEQLLAILLAKRSCDIKIMFPMVATVDEFVNAKNIAVDIATKNDISLDGISFGIMIEVPSVLFLIEEFDKVVDFYSIGTNDLSQYLFAIDRTHASLKIDSYSSVLFDAIKLIRKQSTKPVSICGELASDTRATKTLIDMGIETLSVTPAMIPTIKARIRDV